MSEVLLKLAGSKARPRHLRISIDRWHVHVSIAARPDAVMRRIGLDCGAPIGWASVALNMPHIYGSEPFALDTKKRELSVGLASFYLSRDEAELVRQKFEPHGLIVKDGRSTQVVSE